MVVNASLNWTSIIGLILFFYGVLTVPLAIAQIFFILQRRSDTSPAVIAKIITVLMQAAGSFSLANLWRDIVLPGMEIRPDFAVWTTYFGVWNYF